MEGKLKKRTFVYLLVILFSSLPALAASFTADLVMTEKGKTETGKFYLSGSNYRMEMIEDGKPTVVIADKKKNVHRLLDVNEKIFYEIPSDDWRAMSNDPFKAAEYMAKKYESRKEGREKINGMECEKQVVLADNKIIHAAWISKKLNSPIKLVTYYEGKERSVCELKNIKPGNLPKNMFKPPADFKQKEDPAAAEERKREEQRKAEEALPALTTAGRERVPCYVKIAAGGELHIAIDTDRDAFLEVTNMVAGDSEFILSRFRDGKPSDVYAPKTWKLDRNGHYNKDFNDESDRRSGDKSDDSYRRSHDTLVDEVVIKVDKGLVYAYMRQSGKDRKDFYNRGHLQNGTGSDPKRPVTVKITGDNPFGPKTTGKFYLRHESGAKSDVVPFTVENGKTLTWDYPASKGVKGLDVTIKEGDGRAKISLIQPPDPKKVASTQETVKTKPKPKYTPKAKTVNQFQVTHPAGTSKPLLSGRDLVITVTGVSEGARGTVELFSDSKKTKEVDRFKFTLEKKQAQSHFVSKDTQAVWARVWVHKGSFAVKLDQSPGVKATMKPEPKATSAEKPKPSAKAKQSSVPVASAAKPATATDAIFNGEVPLYQGARVLKSNTYGTNSSASLEVAAALQEVADFYKQAMSAKGWAPVMAMVQGDRGALMFKKKNRQLAFKLRGKGDTSKIDIAMMGQ